jgi:uncharacterized protein (DUF488 family)
MLDTVRRFSEGRKEFTIADQGTDVNPVFTVGHSNHSVERFTELLREHGIEMVADVRSHPYSRHVPHFNARSLEEILSNDGIGHLFLGRELGGRPEGEIFYDSDDRVDYALVGRCHRRLLVGRALEELGFTLRHIRGDGSIQIEGETDGGQPALFPQMEVRPRKSIRSASRRRRRPSSSGH